MMKEVRLVLPRKNMVIRDCAPWPLVVSSIDFSKVKVIVDTEKISFSSRPEWAKTVLELSQAGWLFCWKDEIFSEEHSKEAVELWKKEAEA